MGRDRKTKKKKQSVHLREKPAAEKGRRIFDLKMRFGLPKPK